MQNIVPINYYLILSAIFFVIGAIGFLTRRNIIVIFMALELMLNSVNLTFVTFSTYSSDLAGQIFVFFIMAVAAAEAAVGLAIILALYRNKQTVYLDKVSLLKW